MENYWSGITESEYFRYDESSDRCFCKINECSTVIEGRPGKILANHVFFKHKVEYLDFTNSMVENSRGILCKECKPLEVKLTVAKIQEALVEMVTVNEKPYSLMNDSGLLKMLTPLIEALPKDQQFAVSPNIVRNMVYLKAMRDTSEELKDKILHFKIDVVRRDERHFLAVHIQYSKNEIVVLKNLLFAELENTSQEEVKSNISKVFVNYEISKDDIFSVVVDDGSNLLASYSILNGENRSEKCSLVSETLIDHLKQCVLESEKLRDYSLSSAIHNVYYEVLTELLTQEGDKIIRALVVMRKKIISLNIPSFSEESLKWLSRVSRTTLVEQPYWVLIIDLIDKLLLVREFREYSLEKVYWKDEDWIMITSFFDCLIYMRNLMFAEIREDCSLSEFYANWYIYKTALYTHDRDLDRILGRIMDMKEDKLLKNNLLLASIQLDPRFKDLLIPADKVHLAEIAVMNLWERLKLRDSELKKNQLAASEEFSKQLREFIELPRLNFEENLREYWKKNRSRMPLLYKVAQFVHSVPVSRKSMNRLFFGMKNIVDDLTCDISEEVTENFTTLRSQLNLGWLIYDKRSFKSIETPV